MFLDSLVPSKVKTFFELGVNGNLGAADAFVIHRKKFYANAISAHAPSCIEYELDGSYFTFEADVAINDIKEEETCNPINFSVYADDRLVGYVARVRAHEVSKTLMCNINGAKKLRLEADIYQDSYNNWGQSVWLLPQIHQEKIEKNMSITGDVENIFPDKHISTSKCIFTACHSEDIQSVTRMLLSLCKYNALKDTTIVLFASGEIDKFDKLKERYNLTIVECVIRDSVPIFRSTIASLSVHNVVDADMYLYIAPEMLILDDIGGIFNCLDALDDNKILFCANPNTTIVGRNLQEIISSSKSIYGGQGVDCDFLHLDESQRMYPFIISTNVMCMTKKSLLCLEQSIYDMMPYAVRWKNNNPQFAYIREQALINAAIAKFGMGVELNHKYNCQISENNFNNISIGDYWVSYKSDPERIKAIEVNGALLSNYAELVDSYSEIDEISEIEG